MTDRSVAGSVLRDAMDIGGGQDNGGSSDEEGQSVSGRIQFAECGCAMVGKVRLFGRCRYCCLHRMQEGTGVDRRILIEVGFYLLEKAKQL